MRDTDAMDFPAAADDLPLFPMEQREGPFDNSSTPRTPEETLVGSLIWKHKGKENPITIAQLRELTGFSERQIKGVVEALVVTHGMKIGARREDPAGYFVIRDREDLAAALGPYQAQILAMVRRHRALGGADAGHQLLEQIRTALEG